MEGKVTICGIPHKIQVVYDGFNNDSTLGQIEYAPALIRLNGKMSDEMMNVTCIHEVVHSMLTQLGYIDLSENENFVCGLATAIDSVFKFKEEMPWERTEVSNLKTLLEKDLNKQDCV